MWNAEIGFMESRNSDGSWAGEDEGWTEGDHWAYSLDVMASFFFIISCLFLRVVG